MIEHFGGPYRVQDNTDTVGGQLRVDSLVDGAMAICGVVGRSGSTLMAELHANAHRIAACLNACDGISTKTLEDAVSAGGVVILKKLALDEIVQRAKQRDALLAALERLTSAARDVDHGYMDQAIAQADDAIATIKITTRAAP